MEGNPKEGCDNILLLDKWAVTENYPEGRGLSPDSGMRF